MASVAPPLRQSDLRLLKPCAARVHASRVQLRTHTHATARDVPDATVAVHWASHLQTHTQAHVRAASGTQIQSSGHEDS